MQAVETPRREVPNGRPAAAAPRSVQIASGGLRTTADICRFGSALATDIMTEAVNHKSATAACRAVGMVLRSAEFQLRHGSNGPVVLDDRADLSEADPLAERERHLREELAAIEKERAAK